MNGLGFTHGLRFKVYRVYSRTVHSLLSNLSQVSLAESGQKDSSLNSGPFLFLVPKIVGHLYIKDPKRDPLIFRTTHVKVWFYFSVQVSVGLGRFRLLAQPETCRTTCARSDAQ